MTKEQIGSSENSAFASREQHCNLGVNIGSIMEWTDVLADIMCLDSLVGFD